MLKLPYAIRDFEKLITERFMYFDRTDRIALMENIGYELLFLRPRRFGRALAETIGDVVGNGEMRQQRIVLEHHVDRPAIGRHPVHPLAVEEDISRGRLLEAGHHAQGRGLAAA